MTTSLGVVCASPPGFNPGMAAVDQALLACARRHHLEDRLGFYRLYPAPGEGTIDAAAGAIPYRTLPAGPAPLADFEAVLYWGDFLHMWQYHEAVARILHRQGRSDSLVAALTHVREVFLREGATRAQLRRTLSFGGTLLFNTLADEARPDYGSSLIRFLRESHSVRLRDVYSAVKAAHLTQCYDRTFLGVDCAVLLHLGTPISGTPTSDVREPTVGLFFGRGEVDVPAMAETGLRLATALGAQPRWQPWGTVGAFPALSAIQQQPAIRALAGWIETSTLDARALISQLARHRCLVTDTYHLCVNAWAQGVPAICIAGPEPVAGRSVNRGSDLAARDKRYTFFAMYDALDFYVSAAELADAERLGQRIRHIATLIEQAAIPSLVTARLRQHALAAEQALMADLSAVLAA